MDRIVEGGCDLFRIACERDLEVIGKWALVCTIVITPGCGSQVPRSAPSKPRNCCRLSGWRRMRWEAGVRSPSLRWRSPDRASGPSCATV